MHGLLHYGHRLPRERTLEAEEPRVPPGKDSNQCLRDRGEDPVGARRREDEDDVGRGSKEMKREGCGCECWGSLLLAKRRLLVLPNQLAQPKPTAGKEEPPGAP